MKNLLYIFVLIFFSCGKKSKENLVKENKKPQLSIIKEHNKISEIKAFYKNETDNWKEFNALDLFLQKFKSTSSNEALSNALELKGLVKNLKDSIIPEKFNIPSFKARINILNNEVLRLTDLTYIPSISAKEVNSQVGKVISSFSSLKEKINTILSQKQFENAIDFDLNTIGIDTTKLDSISKQTIRIKKKEQESSFKLNKEGLIKKEF